MKTKVSVFILLLIEIGCLASYFMHGTKETSELENRTLMTFDMVFNNPPEEDSIVYKATASERFEEALKDQFFGRDWVSLHYVDYTAFLDNVYIKGKRTISGIVAFAIVYDLIMVGVFIICVIFLEGETFNPFIYFRF